MPSHPLPPHQCLVAGRPKGRPVCSAGPNDRLSPGAHQELTKSSPGALTSSHDGLSRRALTTDIPSPRASMDLVDPDSARLRIPTRLTLDLMSFSTPVVPIVLP
ncbi:hypothetical protein E4U54_006376 [Claviceps lovelessii]|nr:hypothetical protein E4U54_006376 [Claviceps lovelessii]